MTRSRLTSILLALAAVTVYAELPSSPPRVQIARPSAVYPSGPVAGPHNTSAPTIVGALVKGTTLKAEHGVWTESPSGYTYQWESCNGKPVTCTPIEGATAIVYELGLAMVGKKIRVAVTAHGGGTARSIEYGPVEEESTEVPVFRQVGLSTGGTEEENQKNTEIAINKALGEASNEHTEAVCLKTGHYKLFGVATGQRDYMKEVNRTGYVILDPCAGAEAILEGMHLVDYHFVRFTGFTAPSRWTEGVEIEDSSGPRSSDVQFTNNEIISPVIGFLLNGSTKENLPARHILIEHNYIENIRIAEPKEKECQEGKAPGGGKGGGQALTMTFADGVTFRENVINGVSWHYLQGGAGKEGLLVEHNLFLGHEKLLCAHLNLWDGFSGGENVTFRYNLGLGEGRTTSKELLSSDAFYQENGSAGGTCADAMTNVAIEDNLLVNGASARMLRLEKVSNSRVTHNTLAYGQWGAVVGQEGPGKCGYGTNNTFTNNISAETFGTGEAALDYAFGCTGIECLFNTNVSQDTSANKAGATETQTSWTPCWTTTTWNPYKQIEEGTRFPKPPAHYYEPCSLTITAGYEGAPGV